MAPLSPYRVLDLTDEKGHLCGKVFADLGAEVIKVEPIGGDPARLEHRRELDELVGAWTRHRSAREVMDTLQQAGVPAGVVWNARELLEDPQLNHRGFYQYLEHPVLGKALHYGWPGILPQTPYQLRAGPCLGQDTVRVCQEVLGLSDEELATLVADEVLR